jgi:hypothetical protein
VFVFNQFGDLEDTYQGLIVPVANRDAALLRQCGDDCSKKLPFNEFGKFTRADDVWAGWIYATDADTGGWKWRLKSNYLILSAVTPTAGGLAVRGKTRHFCGFPLHLHP